MTTHAPTPGLASRVILANAPGAKGKIFLPGATLCSAQAVSKSKSPTRGTDKQNNV